MNVIETKNLCKSYKNINALRGLSLSVPQGHIYGFLGPNGAGKTTTIKILLSLLKKDKGYAKIFGEEVRFGYTSKNTKVGFVPEDFSLYGYMRGNEIINFNAQLYRKKVSDKIEKMQNIFNIPLNRKISTYSRGMKKLISLYIALSTEPELLILDEPTDGLDPIVRKKLLSFLIEEVANRNITIFFSSHILSEAEKVSDTIGLIKNGRMLVQGSIDSIKENAAIITFKAPGKVKNICGNYKTVGENIYQCKVFENKENIIKKLKAEKYTIVLAEPIPFEEIFMHYMEDKNESTV